MTMIDLKPGGKPDLELHSTLQLSQTIIMLTSELRPGGRQWRGNPAGHARALGWTTETSKRKVLRDLLLWAMFVGRGDLVTDARINFTRNTRNDLDPAFHKVLLEVIGSGGFWNQTSAD